LEDLKMAKMWNEVKISNLMDYTREQAYAMSKAVGEAWDYHLSLLIRRAEETKASRKKA